jgi:hypothetical protein
VIIESISSVIQNLNASTAQELCIILGLDLAQDNQSGTFILRAGAGVMTWRVAITGAQQI